MNIAISNIAWEHDEDGIMSGLLQKYGINSLEIALSKIWANPLKTPQDELINYKKFWRNKGIYIDVAQSILYSRPELLLFKDREIRKDFISYIQDTIEVLSLLGVKIIVFGASRNRYRFAQISERDAYTIAAEAFFQIANYASSKNIYFCIEPNPKSYGCNFITTTEEAIKLIRMINHTHFCLHLDTSCMFLSNESYKTALNIGHMYLKHFHISEPNLKPIGENKIDHKKVASALQEIRYSKLLSIEMKSIRFSLNKKLIERAIRYVNNIYVGYSSS